MWDVGQSRNREGGGKLLKLSLKDGYSRKCMESPYSRYQECCKINCAVHMADKARQWHARQALREERDFQRSQKEKETAEDREMASAPRERTASSCTATDPRSKSRRGLDLRGPDDLDTAIPRKSNGHDRLRIVDQPHYTTDGE